MNPTTILYRISILVETQKSVCSLNAQNIPKSQRNNNRRKAILTFKNKRSTTLNIQDNIVNKHSREPIVQSWDRVLVLDQLIQATISPSCFADTETHTRWETLTVNNRTLPTSMQTPDHLEPEP